MSISLYKVLAFLKPSRKSQAYINANTITETKKKLMPGKIYIERKKRGGFMEYHLCFLK